MKAEVIMIMLIVTSYLFNLILTDSLWSIIYLHRRKIESKVWSRKISPGQTTNIEEKGSISDSSDLMASSLAITVYRHQASRINSNDPFLEWYAWKTALNEPVFFHHLSQYLPAWSTPAVRVHGREDTGSTMSLSSSAEGRMRGWEMSCRYSHSSAIISFLHKLTWQTPI